MVQFIARELGPTTEAQSLRMFFTSRRSFVDEVAGHKFRELDSQYGTWGRDGSYKSKMTSSDACTRVSMLN